MNEKNDKLITSAIIDPTHQTSSSLLKSISKPFDFVKHHQLFRFVNSETKLATEVVFTHPMFRLNKPIRTSKKTGQSKPGGDYYVVFHPQELGSGAYGCVYPIIGTWKQVDTNWIFKTKSTPDKQRVVKTNALQLTQLKLLSKIEQSYGDEQSVGQWVKHIGLDYKPVQYDGNLFLIMRLQIGLTMQSIIQELKVSPNTYSIVDRLKITINLLEELETQIHGVVIPAMGGMPGSYLVHCDIKPTNIIISPDLRAKFIDYGFAKPYGSKDNYKAGTRLYMDAELINQLKKTESNTSDLYSLSRVIAQLWGDTSADNLKTINNLKSRNQHTICSELLTGITAITSSEKISITNIIRQLLHPDSSSRLSRTDALQQFKDLLATRLTQEEKTLAQMIKRVSLKNLTPDQLLFILNSTSALEFIKKHEKKTEAYQLIDQKLQLRILELDENILIEIKRRFSDYPKPDIIKILQSSQLSVSKIAKLITFCSPVSSHVFNFWINIELNSTQELSWAMVCRLLYNATENANKIIEGMTDNSTFSSVYCKRFLANKQASIDDELNVGLIKRHLAITAQHANLINTIQNHIKDHMPNTPIGLAILSSLAEFQATESLTLVKEQILEQTNEHLIELHHWEQVIKELEAKINLQHRTIAIQAIRQKLNSLKQLEHCTWQQALLQINQLKINIQNIILLDELLNKLTNASPKHYLGSLHIEFDEYYSLPISLYLPFHESVSKLCNIFYLLHNIQVVKDEMSTHQVRFKPKTLIENEFARITASISLKDQERTYQILNSYYQIYSISLSLYKQCKLHQSINTQLSIIIEDSLQKIHAELAEIYPEDLATKIAEQIRQKANAMITTDSKKHPIAAEASFFYNSKPKGNSTEEPKDNFYAFQE